MEIKLDQGTSEPKDLHNILFDRPVGLHGMPSVALLVGRHAPISEVSKFYETMLAFGIQPLVISDEVTAQIVPAGMVLKGQDKLRYKDISEIIDAIQQSQVLYIAVGTEINAALSLLLDRVCMVYKGVVAVDNPKLLQMNWLGGRLCIAEISRFLKKIGAISKGAGLKNTVDKLVVASSTFHAAITAINQNQAVGLCSDFGSKIGVINSERQIDIPVLSAILISLLSEKNKPLDKDWLKYLLVAGYLYRNHYAKGGAANLKSYLNSHF